MSSRITGFALHCSISAVVLVGCHSDAAQVCTTDDQCASHFCKADGTCGLADGMPDAGSNAADAPGTGLCAPNHDGMITANEVPLGAGKMANFRVATGTSSAPIMWNTAGTAGPTNTRVWSLSAMLANDTDVPVTTSAPTGAWWAADAGFETATYWTTLAASSDLIGVFHVDATGVTLLGIVSPTKTYPYTELKYAPPARILAVPFAAASTWSSTSTVTGEIAISGVEVSANYTEAYASTVDQTGTMTTPYGDFPVLRVATVLTDSQVGFGVYKTVHSFAWVAECFGSVATASRDTTSDSGSGTELTKEDEIRRLLP